MSTSLVSRRSFLKASAAFAGAGAVTGISRPVLASEGIAQRPLMAYVGTYSSPEPFMRNGQLNLPPGNGQGIHLFHVDRTTGALSPAGVQDLATSPTCLTLNAAGTRLYSANATATMEDGDSGAVSAYAIDPVSGQLTHLNTLSSGSAGPTYVSVHPSGKFLLVANYFGGSIAVLPILPDGKLGPATDVKKSVGTLGPKKATDAPIGGFGFSGHEAPHSHMIQTDPAGRFILSAEMGSDEILVWKLDLTTGKLTLNDPSGVSLPPGDGPRHFAFHPVGHWLYSLQEESSTIVRFDYDAVEGRLTARQTVSTLPPGFAGTNMASEILISPDGKFLYASNRLHDSIAIFSIHEKDGSLTYLGEEWTHGDFPRTFNFHPSGELFYCCNQRGDTITAFRRNPTSGLLTFTGQYTPVGSPGIILFLDLAKSSGE